MTAQSASKETTLDLVDRQVETPVCAARRRRYWLVWWLWAVFGAAVSFRGMPAGGLLIAAAVLTAPFWVLFAAWPIFGCGIAGVQRRFGRKKRLFFWLPIRSRAHRTHRLTLKVALRCRSFWVMSVNRRAPACSFRCSAGRRLSRRLTPMGWGFTWCRPIRFPGFTCRRSKPVACSLSRGGTSPLSHLAPRRTTGRRLAVGRSICGRCLPARRSEALRRKNVRLAVKQANRTTQKLYGSGLVRGPSLILFSKCLFASRTHGREYHDEKEKG